MGADNGSDHLLMVGKLCLKRKSVVKESARRTLDLDKLKELLTQREFGLRLQNRFEALTKWMLRGRNRGLKIFAKMVIKVVLGYSTRQAKE